MIKLTPDELAGLFQDQSSAQAPLFFEDGVAVLHTESPHQETIPPYEITVLILTINEAKNVSLLIPEIKIILGQLNVSYEVLIVDGGSTDDTVEIAHENGARVVLQKERGYASAFIQGIAEACGRYIITLDGDYSHPAELIKTLYEAREEADLIIGSRWIKGGSFHGPLLRKYLSLILNFVSQKIIDLPVKDISSGYRLYRTSFIKNLTLSFKDFSVLEEVIVKAANEGRRFKEVPLQYRPRMEGQSNARLIKFCISFLKMFYHSWFERRLSTAGDYEDRAYDSRNLIQRWWQRKRFNNIRALLGKYTTAGNIVDIGCGSSKIIQSLPHAIALDRSMNKLRFLKRRNPYRVCASVTALPFTDKSMDAAICSQVIGQEVSLEDALPEIRRILKPEGTLIISAVDSAAPFWPMIEWMYAKLLPFGYVKKHITYYTEKQLSEKLSEAGFSVTNSKRIPGGEFALRARKN